MATAFHITPPAFPITHSSLTVTHTTTSVHTSPQLTHIQYKHLCTCFLYSYFQHKQTYTVLHKPLTTIHKCRCAHGINTACGHSFLSVFCLNIHFFYTVHCYKSFSHHSFLHDKPKILFLTLSYTYMQTQTHAQSLFELQAAVSCALSPNWAFKPSNMQFCLCIEIETCLSIHLTPITG